MKAGAGWGWGEDAYPKHVHMGQESDPIRNKPRAISLKALGARADIQLAAPSASIKKDFWE